jgi:hypothetical protein
MGKCWKVPELLNPIAQVCRIEGGHVA